MVFSIVSLPPFVRALDDYHGIESHPVHEGIAFLVEQMPPRVQAVLSLPPCIGEVEAPAQR